MFRILYRFLAGFARLAVRSGRSKDLEIIVLRHQLQILRRQVDQPAVNDNDRTLLGAIGAALTSRLHYGWVVTPETCCAGTANASPGTGPSPRLVARAGPRKQWSWH